VRRFVPEVQAIFERNTSILWHDAASFTGDVQSGLDSQAAAVTELAGQARSAGMASVSGMRLQIFSTFEDARQSSHDPLPAIGAKEIVLP
jgi:hypothetical protein